jgi:C-terminal processing protease CtpA/Prc
MRWATYPTVHTVDEGSQAERVGLQAGDVILMINGADSRDPETLTGRPGKVFVYRIRRAGTVREYTLTSTAGPVPARNR